MSEISPDFSFLVMSDELVLHYSSRRGDTFLSRIVRLVHLYPDCLLFLSLSHNQQVET